MDNIQSYLFTSGILPWLLGAIIISMLALGRKIGISRRTKHKNNEEKAEETIVGAIFGLLALIIAFSFSGASDRYDYRRHLIEEEVSTIGTAYSSVDLLDVANQLLLREHFKNILDQRIALYKNVIDTDTFQTRLDTFDKARNSLWSDAVKSVKDTQFPEKLVVSQILPQISDMNDALEKQRVAMKMHPPKVITISLLFLILAGAFITGYNLGLTNRQDWLLIVIFVTLMSGTYYITVNLEYPLVGFIGFHDFEAELLRLRQSM